MARAEDDGTVASLASEGRGLEEWWVIFITGPRSGISVDDGLFLDIAMTLVGHSWSRVRMIVKYQHTSSQKKQDLDRYQIGSRSERS